MEYINGMPINKILEEDYEAFAKQVLKFGLVTILIHGVSHGDLHCGNVLFIKDENDEKYKYKVGVLDFGIIYEADQKFKQSLMEFASEMMTSPTEELAIKVLNTGLIEPLEVIQNLPKFHYDNIIKINLFVSSDKVKIQLFFYQIGIFYFYENLVLSWLNSNIFIHNCSTGFRSSPIFFIFSVTNEGYFSC